MKMNKRYFLMISKVKDFTVEELRTLISDTIIGGHECSFK